MMIPNGSTRQMQIETRIDPATGAIQSGGLAPGRYHLAADAIAGLGDLSSVEVDVPAGGEATVDLRTKALEPQLAAKMQKIMVRVEKDAHVFSGVEVAIFSNAFTPEVIQQRMDAWVQAKDAAAKADALNKVREAGEPAREMLPPEQKVLTVVTPLDDLRFQLGTVGDGLELLASDLSDDAGIVHFPPRAGRVCWAVARVRGQWLGMKQFVVPDGDAAMAPVVVPLEGLRPVVAPPPVNSNPPMSYGFTILKPEGMERRVLWRALTDDHLWGASGWGGGNTRSSLVLAIHPGGFTFDGLPPGTVILLQPPGRPGTRGEPAPVQITIEKGEGAMALKVD